MAETLTDRARQIFVDSKLTQRAFAAEIELDPDKLSKALAGKRQFSSLELALIAEAGGRSVEWLITGRAERRWQVAARSSKVDQQQADLAGEASIADVAERYDALRSLGYAPPVPSRPRHTAGSFVRQATGLAEAALALLAEPVGGRGNASLIGLVEDRLGINVAVGPLPEGLDGLSYQDGDFRIIVLAQTANFARQRFTLGHEVGHLLWGDADEQVLVETMYDHLPDDDHSEARANAFAPHFLAPREEIVARVAERSVADAFGDLCSYFQLSPKALSWQLLNLNLIDKEDQAFFGAVSAREIAMELGQGAVFLRHSEMSQNERRPWRMISAYVDAYSAGETTLRPIASLIGKSLAETTAFFVDDGSGPSDSQV